MDYRGIRDGMSVSAFMNTIHTNLVTKYKARASMTGDVANAKRLTEFFKDIKTVQAGGQASAFEQETIEQVLGSLPQFKFKGNTFRQQLFTRTGGARFERDIAKLATTVVSQIAEEGSMEKVNNLVTGNVNAENNIDPERMASSVVQQMLQLAGTKTQKYFTEEDKKSKMLKYYHREVYQKIDVQGLSGNITFTIKASASAELVEIANLLNDATFSAKNYGNWSWDRTANNGKGGIIDSSTSDVKFGATDVSRSLTAIIQSLGYDIDTAISATYAALNEVDDNPELAIQLYHMRIAYELSGAGQILDGNIDYKGAKYIIYNNPDTDEIIVRSTAELINEMFENNTVPSDWKSTIYIARRQILGK